MTTAHSLLWLKVKQASNLFTLTKAGLGSVHSSRTDWALNELLIIHNYMRCKKTNLKSKTWGFFPIHTDLWFFLDMVVSLKAILAFTNRTQRSFQNRIWKKLLELFLEYINSSKPEHVISPVTADCSTRHLWWGSV